MRQEGLACMTMWVKAGQLGGPRGEIIFLTFPTAGARAQAQMPEPKAEGLGWIWGDGMEQGDPKSQDGLKGLHW